MPTGYTSLILEKPETTFEQFAMRCAKAFGACIEMRDDPIDAEIPEFKPSQCVMDSLDSAKKKLEQAMGYQDYQWRDMHEEEIQDGLRRREESRQKDQNERKLFESMMEQVRAWKPPTDEHVGLKEFMLKQLAESLPEMRTDEWYERYSPIETDLAKFKKFRIEILRDSVNYYEKVLQGERERAESRNLWVKQLRESLGQGVQW